uniref:Uncharacterized protein n=1 Tax=Anopheles culicifacies TaxID=139723 RepID=A0A182MDT0_9DIPT
MPVPVLPLAVGDLIVSDTSDGGDVSICSNLDDLEEDDDDEKTETIDVATIQLAPALDVFSAPFPLSDASGDEKPSEGSSNGGSSHLMACTTVDDVTGNGTVLSGTTSIDYELAMINHPDVQREEELIAFKEKYSHLSEENVRLNQKLQQLTNDMSQSRQWFALQIVACIVPVMAIFCYMLTGRS